MESAGAVTPPLHLAEAQARLLALAAPLAAEEVPVETQQDAVAEALRTLSAAGQGSFLAVLKSLGPLRSGGLVSFEGPGASLALDFPNRGEATLKLLERLDHIVVTAGGKVYPAKDGRMSAATFRAGYPRWRELEALRDPLFSSRFWRRVTHDQ